MPIGAYQKAIEEIKDRPEWETVAKANSRWRRPLLSPLRSRLGSDDDRSAVETGSSFGSMRPYRDGVGSGGGRGAEVIALVKLQELAFTGKDKPPIRKCPGLGCSSPSIQTQQDLESALQQLRDTLQKFIDEGTAIILE